MKTINKGSGVFYIELEPGETEIKEKAFYHRMDIVELHLPNGLKKIGNEAFMFCYNLKKIYLPSSVKELGHSIFYNINHVEVFYEGTSKEFIKLVRPDVHEVSELVRGHFDSYPYYNSDGSYYKTEKRVIAFDETCPECEVVCNDGERLYYGFCNYQRKPK